MNSLQEDYIVTRLQFLCGKYEDFNTVLNKFQKLNKDTEVYFRFNYGVVLICPGDRAYTFLNKLMDMSKEVQVSKGKYLFYFEFDKLKTLDLFKMFKEYKIVKEEDTIYRLLKE